MENIAESIRMYHKKKLTLTPARTGNITSGQFATISFCVVGAQHYGFIETEILCTFTSVYFFKKEVLLGS
jgi:hypothetical protein